MGRCKIPPERTRPVYTRRCVSRARRESSLCELEQYLQHIQQVCPPSQVSNPITCSPSYLKVENEKRTVGLIYNSETDKSQNFNTNRDHPKIYFGKWKHNVAVTFNDDFANDCLGAVLHKKDYHSDDYQFFAADSLVPGTAVPGEFFLGSGNVQGWEVLGRWKGGLECGFKG